MLVPNMPFAETLRVGLNLPANRCRCENQYVWNHPAGCVFQLGWGFTMRGRTMAKAAISTRFASSIFAATVLLTGLVGCKCCECFQRCCVPPYARCPDESCTKAECYHCCNNGCDTCKPGCGRGFFQKCRGLFRRRGMAAGEPCTTCGSMEGEMVTATTPRFHQVPTNSVFRPATIETAALPQNGQRPGAGSSSGAPPASMRSNRAVQDEPVEMVPVTPQRVAAQPPREASWSRRGQ